MISENKRSSRVPRIPLRYEFRKDPSFFSTCLDVDVFEFENEWSFLIELCSNLFEDRGRFQSRIQSDLRENSICKSWANATAPISTLAHFTQYQQQSYPNYQKSARVFYDRSVGDISLFMGLSLEILHRGISVPSGCRVFHGCAASSKDQVEKCKRFLSTTLDPVVAINSAIRQSFGEVGLEIDRSKTKYVFVIDLVDPKSAIWGQDDESVEFELLFAPPNKLCQIDAYTAGDFELLHFTLGC